MVKARLWLMLGLWAAACAGCNSTLPKVVPGLPAELSDEEQIATVLDEVHAGMQSLRPYKVLAHLSPSYLDQEGRDYAAIRDYVTEILRKYRDIRITRVRPLILVQGDRARAIETFGTVAQPYDASKDPVINLQGQVSVYLERVNNQWMIVEWGPIR